MQKDNLPDNWGAIRLSEVIQEFRNGFASGERDEDGIVQIRMNNVTTDGHLIFDSFLKVPRPEPIKDWLLRKGDFLFNNTNSIDLVGKSAVFSEAPFPCTYSNHFTRIRFKREFVLPKLILYHFLILWRKGYFKSIAIRHVGQSAVHNNYLLKLQLHVPPLHEQEKIVEILTMVDQAIERVDEAIEKTQRLKQGLTQELLTKGIGHKDFKDTALGKIPKDWQVAKIGDLIKEINNGFASGKRDQNGVAQVRMNNVTTDGRLILDSFIKVPIPDYYDQWILKKGDFLFNNTNSYDLVGKSAVFNDAPFPCTFSNHFTRIRFNKEMLLPELVLYHFVILWEKGYFKSVAIRHVGQSAVHNRYLLNLQLPLPTIVEQQKITEILRSVDRRIDSLRKKKETLVQIKKGLMDDLLTGRKRVKLET